MDYKRIKRIDIIKWLKQGNAIVYAFILAVLVVSLIFVYRTINSVSNSAQNATDDGYENGQNASSVADNQSYKICVNKSNNFMTVFKLDTNGEFTSVYKVFRCSVNSDVKSYDSKITEKSAWRKLDDNVYGHYVSKLSDSVCIHSAPYSEQNNSKLIVDAYNRLGNTAQIGYIYLSAADAKWIYENCGINTPVSIYEDQNEKPPVDLPDFATVANGTSYDPTDDRSSDILQKNTGGGPKIKYMRGVTDCTIALNSEFDKLDGVCAVDTDNNDITNMITITGDLNTAVPGVYTLIYHLSDNYGNNLAYYRYVTVTDTPETSADSSGNAATDAANSTENGNNTGSDNNGNNTSGSNSGANNSTGNNNSGNSNTGNNNSGNSNTDSDSGSDNPAGNNTDNNGNNNNTVDTDSQARSGSMGN